MRICFPEIKSTNSWLLEQLANGETLADETVVWTSRQTAGRGQVGNVWEAEPDKNLSMSMLLHPTWLAPREQFVISEMTAIAVARTVGRYLPQGVSIKWPNDIYVGDEKIAGILIENRLQGTLFAHCVIGIGLNVNQERWVGNAPNPTSIKLKLGQEVSVEEVLDVLTQSLSEAWHTLKTSFERGLLEETRQQVHDAFQDMLYRKEGLYPYVDASTQEAFRARLQGVERTGQLCLETEGGDMRRYWFKEVKFVLPCGTIKE